MDVEFLRYKYEDGAEGIVTKKSLKIGVRHLQALYMFAVSVVLGMLRGSSGIAMLAVNDASRLNDTYIEIHNWDRKTQDTTFSCFLIGYALMLIPAELCISQLGSKLLVTAVLAINGGFCAAMPNIVNKGGWIAVCNTQFLLGMSQAFLAPANRVMLENWMPPNEKTLFSSLVFSGTHLGMIIAMPYTGALSTHQLGWELIFYAQAMAALSACIIWAILTAASPQRHQAVGDAEKEYIEEAKGFYKKKKLKIPWQKILRSSSFWALASAHAAFNAVFVFFLYEIPYYFNTFGRSLKDTSILTMVPFLAMWFVYATTSPTIEWFYNSGFMSYVFNTTYYRKFINALGAFGVIIGLTVLSNLSPDSTLAIVILIISFSLTAFQYSGFLENYRNLSQNFCGTLVTLTSAVAAAVGAGVPLITGFILNPDPTSILTMVPFLAMWFVYATTSPTIEWFYNSGFMSYVFNTTYYRKFINALGAFGVIIGLTVLSNLSPDSTLAIVILIISFSLTAFQYSGFLENYRNLSQNFCGTLVTLTSAVAAAVGAGVPLITGFILNPDPTDFRRWRAVFLSLASFSVLGNVLYTVLGRGERAEWDGEPFTTFGYHNNDANQLELEELSLPKTSQRTTDLSYNNK